MGFIIPDVDVWMRGLSRHHPDPKIVYRLGEHVKKRELILATSVRLALLSQTRDDRQLLRLSEALAGFPEIVPSDTLETARLAQSLRHKNLDLPLQSAALWSLAHKLRAKIWSNDPSWRIWQAQGCPVSGLMDVS